jgi:hypothetical protein
MNEGSSTRRTRLPVKEIVVVVEEEEEVESLLSLENFRK